MKIYTEEQVRQAMQKAMIPSIYQMDLWGQLTPIELPTDEEIEKVSPIVDINAHDYYVGHKDGFDEGAKWVLEQIKQQADGTI